MSDETKKEIRVVGVLAQFSGKQTLVKAASEVRSKGFKDIEAYSPFPIHGIDGALGIRPTILPWLVLIAGLGGGVLAMAGQWWTNTVDYPYIISGKPMFSLPANIPVTFEVMILSAASVAFTGMLALNRLPRFGQPLLRNNRFLRVTDDGFFLLVSDDEVAEEKIRQALEEAGATDIEVVTESVEESKIPVPLVYGAVILACFALIPPLMIASARGTTSQKPRLHTWFDMDFQPKLKTQTPSNLFADGRAMRPRIKGTVRRGGLVKDTDTGYTSIPAVGTPGGDSVQEWKVEFPMEVTDSMMDRGRQRFNIQCAVCHGKAGYGNGLATIRALELQQGTWIQPTSLHADHVRQQPVGQIFNSITNGVRKMPAYKDQITPEDRWAIVLYVKALQLSQNATLEDVPADMRETLKASE